MANSNWHRGKAKGRAQAKAWLRHNDKERRKDPQVNHKNRDIDKSRTDRNFEVGPTAGMTYDEKCARLDAALDKWGYPTDGDLGTVNSRTPSCMQGIVVYAPDALDNDEAEADGRLAAWFEKAVDEACKQFGEENVIAAFVDVDEVHDYTDARTGETRTSKRHMHLYVVPVCEVKQTARTPLYVRPDGTETENADEAQQVYITVNNSETDDASKAARNDDGTLKTGPKCARLKSGRRKYKRQKRGEAATSKLMLRGSEFSSTENVTRFNKVVHDMTVREFGVPWNTHEPGTYQRNEGDEDRSVEDLKAASVEREVAQRRAEAAVEIDRNLAQSEALLDEAVAKHGTAVRERDGCVVLDRDGERETRILNTPEDGDLAAFGDAIDRRFRVGGPGPGGSTVVEVRHAPRVVTARAERDAKATREAAETDARRVREEARAENERLRAENERLERDNAAKRSEGERIEAANAARSASLDERGRALRAGEKRLAEDRAKLDDDRAEVSRLLDGCDREATEGDYLDPKHGDRTIAEFYAHKHYWADYHANGGKPKTVHEPGLRETVKAAEEARQGYEQATEEARRERDALREFREGLVKLLEDLCKSVKMTQKEENRKGRKATAKFFGFVHRIFVEPLKALDNSHVPEAPTLDRAAWDEALSAAKAEQARAEVRVHAAATPRVPASSIPREVRTDWEPRKQSNDRGIER